MGLLDRWFNRTIDLNASSAPFWRGFFGTSTTSGEIVTYEKALQLDAVWACVNLRANALATLPCVVYGADGVTPSKDDDLYGLLHDLPNADDTAPEFWSMVSMCLDLDGNFFAEKKYSGTRLVALNPLDPTKTEVKRDAKNARYYEYNESDGTAKNAGIRRIAEDKMFHVRGAILPGCDRGMSPIGMARNVLGNAMSGEKTAGKMFKNGLMSSLIVSSDQILKADQRSQISTTLTQFAGADKAGGVTVLEAGFKPYPMSIKPSDAQMLESRQYSIEQICRIFGVPPVMIGHAANGTTTWGSGIEQLILQFTKTCLTPVLRRIESTIYRDLLDSKTRKTKKVEFNMEGFLRGDSTARAEFLSKMVSAGIYVIDEARAYENKPAVEGGDKSIVNGTMTRLDKLGEVPVAPPPQPPAANTNEKPVPAAPKKAA